MAAIVGECPQNANSLQIKALFTNFEWPIIRGWLD